MCFDISLSKMKFKQPLHFTSYVVMSHETQVLDHLVNSSCQMLRNQSFRQLQDIGQKAAQCFASLRICEALSAVTSRRRISTAMQAYMATPNCVHEGGTFTDSCILVMHPFVLINSICCKSSFQLRIKVARFSQVCMPFSPEEQ